MNPEDRREFVTLREYFESRLLEQEKRFEQALSGNRLAVDAALTAAKEAVDKAEKAQERRLDLLNEFRAQSADESKKYAQKDVVNPSIARLEAIVNKQLGGLIVVGFVGLANLIKVYFG